MEFFPKAVCNFLLPVELEKVFQLTCFAQITNLLSLHLYPLQVRGFANLSIFHHKSELTLKLLSSLNLRMNHLKYISICWHIPLYAFYKLSTGFEAGSWRSSIRLAGHF